MFYIETIAQYLTALRLNLWYNQENKISKEVVHDDVRTESTGDFINNRNLKEAIQYYYLCCLCDLNYNEFTLLRLKKSMTSAKIKITIWMSAWFK